jgi:hypothetical protein
LNNKKYKFLINFMLKSNQSKLRLGPLRGSLFVMPDDMYLGALDADGSVIIAIDSRVNRSGSKEPFGIRVAYEFAQSNTSADLVEKVAAKFGGKARLNGPNTVFRVGCNGVPGKKIRLFLQNNKPLYPGRLHDFLLSEEILALKSKKAQKTKEGLVTLINLAYNNSKNHQKKLSRKKPLQYWIDQINPTQNELIAGQTEANQILMRVKKEVSKLEAILPTKTLSLDYVRGAHYGDGSFAVALTWGKSPGVTPTRLRCEPEWCISGENPFYCEAFVHTFKKGYVNKAGKNYHKFRLSGIAASSNILYVFNNTWMPAYKQNQLSWFTKALDLLKSKKHFTKNGITELVELVYDKSQKGTRKYAKQQYIDWGHAWVDKRNSKN